MAISINPLQDIFLFTTRSCELMDCSLSWPFYCHFIHWRLSIRQSSPHPVGKICINPDSKVHGANMGPIWGRQDPGGPHVGPMNYAIWEAYNQDHEYAVSPIGFELQVKDLHYEQMGKYFMESNWSINQLMISQHLFMQWPNDKYANTHTRVYYNDVIMGAMASQITSLTIVYPTVYSGTDQRKHQSSASLAFVGGIHWWPVNSPHKWPVTRKMFPFDDVIMGSVRCIAIRPRGQTVRLTTRIRG